MPMRKLVARTRIALSDPRAVVVAVSDHLAEHGARVEERDGAHMLRLREAVARIVLEPAGAAIDVTASSLDDLYFMRMMVASHVLDFAGEPSPAIEWTGDGTNVEQPPNFRILRIADVRQVTPRMRRITFAGTDIARFAALDALHLNVLIQHSDLAEPQWPTVGANGLVRWEDPERRPVLRKYTVRSIDLASQTLDIDFVLHADAGPGSQLAETAAVGDVVGVVGPGGGGLAEADRYLFAGDETALPAIARMLEHLPTQARGKAIIEVADGDERQPLTTEADIDVEWLYRSEAPSGAPSRLAAAIRDATLPDRGSIYAWAGCEFEAFRDIRAYLRNDLGLKKHEHLAVAYWRRGAAGGGKPPGA